MASPEAWLWGAIEAAVECDCYPLLAPDNLQPPYVVFTRSSTSRVATLIGSAAVPAGTFLVEIYSDGYKAGKDIADQVREALDNFTGSASGVTILESTLTDESDGEPVFLEGRDRPTYVVEQQYLITWSE